MTRHKKIAQLLTEIVGMFLIVSVALLCQMPKESDLRLAAVSGDRAGQDAEVPFEVVADWPKPPSQLPGHEHWTWGTTNGIFAESADRVSILQRGELPLLTRPNSGPLSEFGPSLSFPVAGEPFRNSGQGPVSSPPGPPAKRDRGRENSVATRAGSTACWS